MLQGNITRNLFTKLQVDGYPLRWLHEICICLGFCIRGHCYFGVGVKAQLPMCGARVLNEEALLSASRVGQRLDVSVLCQFSYVYSPGQDLPSVMHAQLSLTSVRAMLK